MRISYKPIAKGFRVRLMSPLGRYPADTFHSGSAALIISPEICFSIVTVLREDWGFSEVEILTAEEIPLLGSILLAGEPSTPYLYPYPSNYTILLESETVGALADQQIEECKSFLTAGISKHMSEYPPTNVFHKPPLIGGLKYDLTPSLTADSDRLMILRRLESANPVILRGVSCLLKGRMAFLHPEFGESACILLWIALDAAYSLVLRKLRESGTMNPTSEDAAKYFEKLSGFGTEWDKFFEVDYENRIRAIHPDNRFGAEAIPQFLADDFLELNDMLIPFFYHFVSELADDSTV